MDRINTGKESEPHQRNRHGILSRNKALYENLLKGKLDHLTNEKKGTVEPVLLQYAHICHDEDTSDFTGTDVELQILTGDWHPIKRTQYRVIWKHYDSNELRYIKMARASQPHE